MNKWLTGSLMDEAGAGDGGGTAVMEVSTDFGGDPVESTDGAVHEAEFVEEAPAEGQQPEQSTALVTSGERPVAQGRLTGTGKAINQALQPLGPKIAQQVTQALLRSDWFMSEFPGGKKEIAALRQLAADHGGADGIAEMRSRSEQLQEIDTLYEASSPQLIDRITSTEEGKRSFIGLMETALRKFDALAPDRLAHFQAQGVAEGFRHQGLPTLFTTQTAFLNLAVDAVNNGNHELATSFLRQIVEGHNAIHGVIQGVYDLAKKAPPAVGSSQDPKVLEGKQQLEQERLQLRREQWGHSVAQERQGFFKKAWAEQTKGRAITASQDTDIKGFYELAMNSRLNAWKHSGERFLVNNDRDGYIKEQRAFFQKAIPDSLRQALQKALPGKPGPKPGEPLRPPVNGEAAANIPPERRMPPMEEIDMLRTTSAMIREHKAIGKDGKTYQWA